MRILIAGPPKTGNVWIKHILAGVFDLSMLDTVPGGSAAALSEFIAHDNFADNSIFHQHFHPEPALFDAMSDVAPHVVTTLRNPYDTFVSLYYFAQRHPSAFADKTHPVNMLVGKPLDHPDVYSYLQVQYRGNLMLADAWVQCKKSHLVRYEDLLKDPCATVADLAAKMHENPQPRLIKKHVDLCSAKRLKKRGGYWEVHIRTATSGDWKKVLGREHLRILRENHADLIESTGYDVI